MIEIDKKLDNKPDNKLEGGNHSLDELFAKIPTKQQIVDVLTDEQSKLIEKTVNEILIRFQKISLGGDINISLDSKLKQSSIDLIIKRFKAMGWDIKHESFSARNERVSVLIIKI